MRSALVGARDEVIDPAKSLEAKIRETDDFQQRRRDPAGTFVCGASTNGLIGIHLIAACHDYGIPEVRGAQLLAVMGIFDIIGTTAVGLAHRSLLEPSP